MDRRLCRAVQIRCGGRVGGVCSCGERYGWLWQQDLCPRRNGDLHNTRVISTLVIIQQINLVRTGYPSIKPDLITVSSSITSSKVKRLM